MRTFAPLLVLVSLAASNAYGDTHPDAAKMRTAVVNGTKAMIAKGLITKATTSAQIDVTAKFVRMPLDKQAELVTLLCQQYALLEHAEDPEADQNAPASEIMAESSCDVTRNGANALGRTLGTAVQWQTWYLRDQSRR